MKMVQVKIFIETGQALEDAMNKFLRDNKVKTVVNIVQNQLKDYFEDGRVCNRWDETILIYETWRDNNGQIQTIGD